MTTSDASQGENYLSVTLSRSFIARFTISVQILSLEQGSTGRQVREPHGPRRSVITNFSVRTSSFIWLVRFLFHRYAVRTVLVSKILLVRGPPRSFFLKLR